MMARGNRFTRGMGQAFGRRGASWRQPPPLALPVASAGSNAVWGNERLAPDDQTGLSWFNDPSPLGEDERGAVWPMLPAEAFTDNGIREASYDIPREDINTTLLFFDRFDVPRSDTVPSFGWCEKEFSRLGILTQSRGEFEGLMHVAMQMMPFSAYAYRDLREPGRWTLARPAQTFGIPEDRLRPHAAIALTLQNALPVFTRDVDFEEVMMFKVRARSELLALRQHLDELGAEAGRNGADSLTQSVVFTRFRTALEAHHRLMSETNRNVVWRSLKASFDWTEAVGMGVEAGMTGTISMGTVATGAVTLGIKTIKGLKRKRDSSNPFEYITSAHLDL